MRVFLGAGAGGDEGEDGGATEVEGGCDRLTAALKPCCRAGWPQRLLARCWLQQAPLFENCGHLFGVLDREADADKTTAQESHEDCVTA